MKTFKKSLEKKGVNLCIRHKNFNFKKFAHRKHTQALSPVNFKTKK